MRQFFGRLVQLIHPESFKSNNPYSMSFNCTRTSPFLRMACHSIVYSKCALFLSKTVTSHKIAWRLGLQMT